MEGEFTRYVATNSLDISIIRPLIAFFSLHSRIQSINIGKHSDNLENKVIVTVSLGAERSWIMEKKPARTGSKAAKAETSGEAVEKKRWKLKDGSLLVMQGETLEIFRSYLSP